MAAGAVMSPEIGVAGNTGFWGSPLTGEHLRLLEGAAGRAVYDQMRRSDHQVGAVLKAITLPIRQADYFMDPASDDALDVEIAETLQQALLHGMTHTWDDTLRHALLMLPFGFSVLEKVYEYRDGLQLPRKLAARMPQSVERWEYDKRRRRLTHLVQRDADGQEIKIPIEKLLVFTHDKEGDNWEGMSILRTAYKGWFLKDDLEKTNAIMHARWGAGVPFFRTPPAVARGSEEWNEGTKALEGLHANEKAYLQYPNTWEGGVLGKEGRGTDVLGSIEYYDQAIAKAMLALHINLGTSKSGSRALGGTFVESFLMATQATADYVAEVFSRFCVRELVDLNWGVRRRYPTFRVRRIHRADLREIGFLVQSGALDADDSLQNTIRENLRMPPVAGVSEPAETDEESVNGTSG